MPNTTKDGRQLRPTYEEISDYLQNKQQRIEKPNRIATWMRHSHELSNLLDGEGMGLLDLEKAQLKSSIAQQERNLLSLKNQWNKIHQLFMQNPWVVLKVRLN